MKYQHSLLPLFIATALTGCGGSSSGTVDPIVTTDLSGKVADGYLSGANVCLDINNNKICDASDPNATSTEGGAFTLTGVTQAQIDQFPLIVEIIADQTIDEDEPGVPLTQAYTLSAPAGFTFVSPLTTMVQNEIEKGSNEEEAQQLVKDKLGTTIDLDDDYVAGKTDQDATDEEKAEFEKLHQIAQVTANVIANNMGLLETAATEADVAIDDLIALIIDEVFDALDEITVQVEITDDEDFDADTLATAIDDDLIGLDADKLEEQIAQNEAENSATLASLIDLIQSEGINWFWGETQDNGPELDYGTLKLNADGSITDTEYFWENGNWQLYAESDTEQEWLLTSAGWTSYDDTIEGVTLNDDNSITLTYPGEGQLNETITGTEINLAGLNVSLVLQETEGDGTWAQTVPAEIVFPADAVGYKLKFRQTGANYTFNDWDDCDIENKLGDLCNSIWHQKGNGNFADDSSAVTLAEMIVQNAIVLTGTASDLSALNGIHVGWMDDMTLVAELVADGTVNYYKINFSTSMVEKLATGSWNDISVHGETLRNITGPNYLSEFDGFFDNDEQIVLFEYAGGVRIGWLENSESNGDDEFVFNAIAREFILANFDVQLLQDEDPVATEQPTVFTQEWIAGKTLYSVWFGDGDASDGTELTNVAVVIELYFNANGELTGQGLLNASTPTQIYHYRVSDNGLLYIEEEQDEASEGNRIVCGSTADYIKTHFVVNEQFDNVDLYFFDKQKALDYANELTGPIAPCTSTN